MAFAPWNPSAIPSAAVAEQPPKSKPATRLGRERKREFNDPPLVGPWKIGTLIGTGASDRVRLVHHSQTGKKAAIKIIPRYQLASKLAASGSGPKVQKRLEKMEIGIEREIIIMRLTMHDNLLSLIDVYENENVLYLIMEYVEGGELFDHLVACGRLEVDTARGYFRQIMFGVDHCHSFNICHRDLKPENLLLSKDKQQVKIADYGMAALQHSGRMLETSCGSPHYASPEIVSGQRYIGTATDIWSCGIVLFALLCGRLPFDDPNMNVLLQKVKDGRFGWPRSLRDEAAKDLVRRMLVVDPRERYTMTEIFHHPWFTDFGRLSSLNLVQMVTDPGPIEPPPLWEEDEIFCGLTFLFQGYSPEKLQAELCSPADTLPKRFYRLLLKEQVDAENAYDEDDGEDVATASSNDSAAAPPQPVDRSSSSSSDNLTRPSCHSQLPSAPRSEALASSPDSSPPDVVRRVHLSTLSSSQSAKAASPTPNTTQSSHGVTPQGADVAAEALALLQAYQSHGSRRVSQSLGSPVLGTSNRNPCRVLQSVSGSVPTTYSNGVSLHSMNHSPIGGEAQQQMHYCSLPCTFGNYIIVVVQQILAGENEIVHYCS